MSPLYSTRREEGREIQQKNQHQDVIVILHHYSNNILRRCCCWGLGAFVYSAYTLFAHIKWLFCIALKKKKKINETIMWVELSWVEKLLLLCVYIDLLYQMNSNYCLLVCLPACLHSVACCVRQAIKGLFHGEYKLYIFSHIIHKLQNNVIIFFQFIEFITIT